MGLGAMTVNLWLALTVPTALKWLEGAPHPSSATQGWKVSEGGAEGPCGQTCSLWGLGAPVENQSSKAT